MDNLEAGKLLHLVNQINSQIICTKEIAEDIVFLDVHVLREVVPILSCLQEYRIYNVRNRLT